MATTPRQRARERTMADIVRIGRDHLATDGAAALSLRAVARDLGVVSSAVYRYVASRDDLLTLLVVDAYTELADEVDTALAREPGASPLRQFGLIAHAVRGWAVREPARYALLYGSPVPGYAAPAERTMGPGTRVTDRLTALLVGSPSEPRTPPLDADLTDALTQVAPGVDPGAMARGVLAWNALLGMVSAEVFGWYGASFAGRQDALFERQLADVTALLARSGVPE